MVVRQLTAKIAEHVRTGLAAKVGPNGSCPAHFKEWSDVACVQGGQECSLMVPRQKSSPA
ncbi:hypothetical protein K8P10_002872 [Leucobacter sp. Psy1]|nr:hypothetical protein K8P10_002872 [Leucobacter sp. Psy1]